MCEVTNVGAFAPPGVMLPPNTVLHYVAASLKESTMTSGSSNPGLNRVRGDGDKTLRLEVLIQLGVVDVAWAMKYVFPMKLEAQGHSPHSGQIRFLTGQVEELQQEVKTLKEQMKAVVLAQAASQQSPASLSTSPAFSILPRRSSVPVPSPSTNARENGETPPIPSRSERICGHHKLVRVEEYRERQNSSGETQRRHRQHTCKVCSALRGGDRRRPSKTCHYCAECTEQHKGGMIFLCNKVRPHQADEYQNATCSQIWHAMWNNGKDRPQSGMSIRMRKKLKTSQSNEE